MLRRSGGTSADTEGTELPGMRVAGEIDCLEVAQLVEPEPVGVGDLHHHGESVGGPPPLAAGSADASDPTAVRLPG